MVNSSFVSSGSETSDNEESRSPRSDDRNLSGSSRTRHGTISSKSKARSTRHRRPSLPHHTKHYVEHNYHDHARDPYVATENSAEIVSEHHDDDSVNDDASVKKKRGGHRGGVAVPFPEKLHYMLSQMDRNETAHIVNWQPHGRCFVVHKPKEFVEDIMPKFFRQTKMTSFQRQLNLYGFARLTAGPDRGGYYHELFIRGRMDLCKRMVRTRVKGNGSKAASSPSTEPNFYAMAPCYEQITTQDVMKDDDEARPDYEGRDNTSTQDSTDKAPCVVEDQVYESTLTFFDDINDDDAEIVMKPMITAQEEATGTTTAKALDPLKKSFLPRISSPSMNPVETPSLPAAIVSPLQIERSLVSPPGSPHGLHYAPTISLPPTKGPFLSLLDDEHAFDNALPHTGDQVFFEGLPFHYLETKDFEGNLRACIRIVGV